MFPSLRTQGCWAMSEWAPGRTPSATRAFPGRQDVSCLDTWGPPTPRDGRLPTVDPGAIWCPLASWLQLSVGAAEWGTRQLWPQPSEGPWQLPRPVKGAGRSPRLGGLLDTSHQAGWRGTHALIPGTAEVVSAVMRSLGDSVWVGRGVLPGGRFGGEPALCRGGCQGSALTPAGVSAAFV